MANLSFWQMHTSARSGRLHFVGYITSLSLTRSALILDHLDAHVESRLSSQSVCRELMVLTNHRHNKSTRRTRRPVDAGNRVHRLKNGDRKGLLYSFVCKAVIKSWSGFTKATHVIFYKIYFIITVRISRYKVLSNILNFSVWTTGN